MEAILDVLHRGCYTSEVTAATGVTITVLSGHDTPKGSVGLWEVSGETAAVEAAVRRLKKHPHLTRVDVLERREGAWVVETVDVEAGVSRTLVAAGLVFLPPVLIRDGREIYRVFAVKREQISKAVKRISKENEVEVRILRPGATAGGALGSLTRAQREAIEAAFRLGYYDRPRRVEQAEVARALKISRPALAERLQRAQRRLLEGVLG